MRLNHSGNHSGLCLVLVLLVSCGPRASEGRDGSATLLDGSAAAAGEGRADPGQPAPTVAEDAPAVVFLGDSICAGLHLAEHQAFPAVLQRRLAADGYGFQLVSACESGRTTAGGVTALEWSLRSDPAVVVIELGGNDGLRGVALTDIERNLRALIEGSRASGAEVLLLGVFLPSNYGEYAHAFDALYPKLAAEYGLAFVPAFMAGVAGVPDLNLPDGLHPTVGGQEKLADNVIDALRELLNRTGGN